MKREGERNADAAGEPRDCIARRVDYGAGKHRGWLAAAETHDVAQKVVARGRCHGGYLGLLRGDIVDDGKQVFQAAVDGAEPSSGEVSVAADPLRGTHIHEKNCGGKVAGALQSACQPK